MPLGKVVRFGDHSTIQCRIMLEKRRVDVTLRFGLGVWMDDYDEDYENNVHSLECIESEVHTNVQVETPPRNNWKNVRGSGG